MSREFKNYELASSPRPLKNGRYKLLISTVAIRGADKKSYYCYVAFSDKLVEKAGNKLPRGVSEFNPAFLYVDLSNLQMDVYVSYLHPLTPVLLWSQSLEQDLPRWLKLHPTKSTT